MLNPYIDAVRENPLGTLIGPLALVFGGVVIMAYLSRHKRTLRDSVMLVTGAVVVTAVGIAVVCWKDLLPVSTFAGQWLGFVAFVISGLLVWRLLNKACGNKPRAGA